jgi:hypothetical protein
MMKTQFRTHGMSKTRIYGIWLGMMERCYKEKSSSYERYGGRGIKVDEAWHKFDQFYSDMKDTYSDELTLERKENGKSYSNDNCRWASYKEQNENKRNTLYLLLNGERKTLMEWCRIYQVSDKLVRFRIKTMKWDAEKALTTPSSSTCSNVGKLIEYNGQKKTLTQWANQFNIPMKKLSQRLRKGMSMDRALNK